MRDERHARDASQEEMCSPVMKATLAQTGFNGDGNARSYTSKFRSEDASHRPSQKASTFRYKDGRTHSVAWCFKERYLDENTMEPLPQKHIE